MTNPKQSGGKERKCRGTSRTKKGGVGCGGRQAATEGRPKKKEKSKKKIAFKCERGRVNKRKHSG